MVNNEQKDIMIRLIADGHNTVEKLNKQGLDTGTIKYFCSAAHSDSHIADIVGDKIVLTPAGANLLYKLKQQDNRNKKENVIMIATIIAAISGLASAIFLGIQTLGQH